MVYGKLGTSSPFALFIYLFIALWWISKCRVVLYILGMERCNAGPLPFQQQTIEKLFKFEILTSTLSTLGLFYFEILGR